MARRRNPTGGPGGPDLRHVQPLIRSSLNAFSRLDRRAQLVILALLAVAGVIAAVIYLRSDRTRNAGSDAPTTTQPPRDPPVRKAGTRRPADGPLRPSAAAAGMSTGPVNLLLGNPSGATSDPSNRTNYLLVKPYHTLAYNEPAGAAKWVSWRLARGDMGDAPRQQGFDADDGLPPGYYRVTHKDYSGSGFDRGHLCPHADRDADEYAASTTFVMTNIIPQAPNVNQKAWANLENYCRDLARAGNRLYVVAGPVGTGGRGSNGPRQTVADGRVTVPAECWKVVVVVPEGGGDDDLSKVTARTRVIAVVMPNDENAVGEEWAGFRTTPAEVERRTGLRFFDRLRPDVAAALREKVDETHVPPPKPREYNRG